MRDALLELLNVKHDELDGLLIPLPNRSQSLTDRIDTYYYYVRLQDGRPRERDLLEFLSDQIISYCLGRLEGAKVTDRTARRYWRRAKNKFQKKNPTSGEVGELLGYALIEGYLQAPKIISKMALKTNPEMPIHGSDGVHLDIDVSGLTCLHFVEAKLYGAILPALRAAIKSVREAIKPIDGPYSQIDYEVDLVESHLEIEEGPLKRHVSEIFNPYKAAKSNLRYCHTCIIAFDMTCLKTGRASDTDIIRELQGMTNNLESVILRQMKRYPELMEQRWCLIFIPLMSSKQFRKIFNDILESSA